MACDAHLARRVGRRIQGTTGLSAREGQIILSVITARGSGPSSMDWERKNLIFYGQVTHLLDEGKDVDVVYLDFSKAVDTISHNILRDKPDGCIFHCVRNWLDGWSQTMA